MYRILLLLTLPFIALGQDTSEVWQFLPYKKYIAPKVFETIKIDGVADEIAWINAPWSDNFVDILGGQAALPYFDTRVKMMWDSLNIYFFAELKEQDIWGNLKERDTVVFYNNDFEIFLKPYTNSPQYCEIEINCLGTIWDLFLGNTYREGGPILNNWNIDGIQAGISTAGTINNPIDKDTAWYLELAIPWKALRELKFSRLPETIPSPWRINFSRVQWEHEVLENTYQRKRDSLQVVLPEHNWVWSPQGVINMHQPENWGLLLFSEECTKIDTSFSEKEILIQALFHLYRLQEGYIRKNKKIQKNLNLLESKRFLIDHTNYTPQLFITHFGYEIKFDSKDSTISLIINQDGIIHELINE
jgi:hypothetical protein